MENNIYNIYMSNNYLNNNINKSENNNINEEMQNSLRNNIISLYYYNLDLFNEVIQKLIFILIYCK